MSLTFIFAQIFAIFGWLFLVYSYYKDDIQKLLRFQIISMTLNAISFILLGAYAGFFVFLFELIKAILYYKTDKDSYIFLFSLPVYGAIAWFTMKSDGSIAILPIIGSIIDGYVLTRNKNIATIGSIMASILWIIYDMFIMAYSAAAADAVLVVSNFFVLSLGYSHILHIDKLHVIRCYYLSRRICTNINALDRDVYSEEYLWAIDQRKDNFNINSDSILLIHDKKKTVGYIDYVAVEQDEYEHLKNIRVFHDKHDPTRVAPLHKRRKNYVLIRRVTVKKDYESKKMTNLIGQKLKAELRNKSKQGYYIHGILGIAISDFEKDFFKKANFVHYKDYNNNEELYELDELAIKKLTK